jgi:UDP-N-acetylmuramate--alanine ligase
VLNNVSLDHKSLDELRALFGDFARKAKCAIWNADDIESVALLAPMQLKNAVSFGFTDRANVRAVDIVDMPLASRFTLRANGESWPVTLQVPGRHNISNALAAIAAAQALGVPIAQAIHGIERFAGLARRFDIVGIAGGITVIDDFGHNPDKTAATLATLKAFPGRIIAFFQPHGYGPIRVMGSELAQVFARHLSRDDHLILCDPVYFGGTVDRRLGSQTITDAVSAAGRQAEYIASREECGNRIVELAQPGDRIVIMGARDDTLSGFAADLLARLVKASV